MKLDIDRGKLFLSKREMKILDEAAEVLHKMHQHEPSELMSSQAHDAWHAIRTLEGYYQFQREPSQAREQKGVGDGSNQ